MTLFNKTILSFPLFSLHDVILVDFQTRLSKRNRHIYDRLRPASKTSGVFFFFVYFINYKIRSISELVTLK